MRHLDATLAGVAANLALDEALLDAAEADEGPAAVLRFWELPQVAVILGASGKVAEDVKVEECRRHGVSWARRSSGGGTVVLGPGVVCVAVVLPIAAEPRLATVEGAQGLILGRMAEALSTDEATVEVRGSGDLALGDRKCAGSAQRRLRRHVLVHVSLLDDLDLTLIDRYTRDPRRQPTYRAGRTHAAFVANLGLGRERIVRALGAAWPADDPEPAPIPWDRVRTLTDEKFADPSWVDRA